MESLTEELDNLKDTLAARREARARAEAENADSRPTEPVLVATPTPAPASAVPACQGLSTLDADKDGLADACENKLAQQYAPVYYYSREESVFPMAVTQYLQSSSLWFFDEGCRPDRNEERQPAPDFAALLAGEEPPDCGHAAGVKSNRTRSKSKKRTFYLKNLDKEQRVGSSDPTASRVYTHVYPNTLNGITLQYWTFYAYDDNDNHGGDWEGVHILLDRQFKPNRITRITDDGLRYVPWSQVETENERLRLYVRPGSHTLQVNKSGIKSDGCGGIGGFFSCGIELDNPETFTRYDAKERLLNMGERTHPNAEQPFIQYSGLWGNATGGLFKDAGVWGPAYDGRGMLDNGFIAAWADKMKSSLATFEEAFPQEVSP